MINELNYVFINNAISPEINYDNVDELNLRFQSRHFSDIPLEPNFNPIPIQTKYSHFPIINTRKEVTTPINYEIYHNVSFNFNPSTRIAPPSGYFNNINDEINLRNQSHRNENDIYIPSSNSDMYMNNLNFKNNDRLNVPVHSLLFSQPEKHTNISPGLSSIGTDRFLNHTRNQMKDNK
jgi:hypothetical protein